MLSAGDIELSEESPERNLLAAMLQRAHWDLWGLQKKVTATRVIETTDPIRYQQALMFQRQLRRDKARFRREAYRWIFARTAQPFSFKWCCQILDLDPDYVRWAMRKIKPGPVMEE